MKKTQRQIQFISYEDEDLASYVGYTKLLQYSVTSVNSSEIVTVNVNLIFPD